MTFHNRRGVLNIPWLLRPGRGLKLLVMGLVALGAAFLLSSPGAKVWAWNQSPISPVSPLPTQPAQLPTPSPTAQAITPTSIPETPVPVDDQPSQSSDRSRALLVAGGIVLAGLIVGAVVLLVRGQPSDGATR